MATPPQEFGTIMDPVHGSIQLDKYLFKIIDLPEFQRLRKIKQLGGVCYVYPGATHTRFEHSIGVCYIASQLVDTLNKDEQHITPNEKKCIQIAALCHDLGHGPYSHLYDAAVERHFKEKNPGMLKKNERAHEYRSAELIQDVMAVVKKEFFPKGAADQKQENDTWKKYIELVQNMIKFSEIYKEYKKEEKKHEKGMKKLKEQMEKFKRGTEEYEEVTKKYKLCQQKYKENEDKIDNFWEIETPEGGTYKRKSYLFEIVANGFTGIDVDKMDYFARDARSIGLPNNFDWRRYTQTAKILECDDGYYHICSREKDALNLYELFHTRNLLHRTVYWHKTVAVIQEMMLLALVEANNYIKVNGRPLLECWEDKDSFQLLDDTIEDFIMKKTENNSKVGIIIAAADGANKKARDYFMKIKERKIWKFVGRHQDPKLKKEDIAIRVAENEAGTSKDIEGKLKSIDTKFNYGMGEDDPIQFHYFYGKMHQMHPFHLDKDEVSRFLPAHGKFQETAVLWYYSDDDATVTAALWEYFHLSKLKPAFKDALETVYAKRRSNEPVDEDLQAKVKRFRSEQ